MNSPASIRQNPWKRAGLFAALVAPASVMITLAPMAILQERNAAIGQATALAASAATSAGEQIADRLNRAFTIDSIEDSSGILIGSMELDPQGALTRPQPVLWPPAPTPLEFPSESIRSAWTSAKDALAAKNWPLAATQFSDLAKTLAPDQSATSERLQRLATGYAAIAELESGFVAAHCANAWKELILERRGALTEAGLPIDQCLALRWFELSAAGHLQRPPTAFVDWEKIGSELADTPGGALWEELAQRFSVAANPLSTRVAQRFQTSRTLRQIHRAMMQIPGEPPPENVRIRVGSKAYLVVRRDTRSREWSVYDEHAIQRLVNELWSRHGGLGVLEAAWRLEGPGFAIHEGRIASAQLSRFVRSINALPATEFHLDVGENASSSLAKTSTMRQWMYGILGGLGSSLSLAGAWLTHRALRRHEELAQRQSGFISSVSHELRAPVASIRLLAEGLDSAPGLTSETRREAAQLIAREARRLGGLIQNVLHLSRVERGLALCEFEPTDLRQLIAETVKLIAPSGLEWDVRLEWIAPEGVCECDCDPSVIQQALTNLIDNALKHSPKGATVTVELSATNPTPLETIPGWRLTVRDSGPGIPNSELTKIFEPFYRIGNELRRDTSGIGLGLAIVQNAAKTHGGKVTAKNRTTGGAEFILWLPLQPNASQNTSP